MFRCVYACASLCIVMVFYIAVHSVLRSPPFLWGWNEFFPSIICLRPSSFSFSGFFCRVRWIDSAPSRGDKQNVASRLIIGFFFWRSFSFHFIICRYSYIWSLTKENILIYLDQRNFHSCCGFRGV